MKTPPIFHKVLKFVRLLDNYSKYSPRSASGVLANLYLELDSLASLIIEARNANSNLDALQILAKCKVTLNRVNAHLQILMTIRGITPNQLGDLLKSLNEISTDMDKWHQHFENIFKSEDSEVKAV